MWRELLLVGAGLVGGASAATLLTAAAQSLPNPIQPADAPVQDSGVLGTSDFVYVRLKDGTRCVSPRGGGAVTCQWGGKGGP